MTPLNVTLTIKSIAHEFSRRKESRKKFIDLSARPRPKVTRQYRIPSYYVTNGKRIVDGRNDSGIESRDVSRDMLVYFVHVWPERPRVNDNSLSRNSLATRKASPWRYQQTLPRSITNAYEQSDGHRAFMTADRIFGNVRFCSRVIFGILKFYVTFEITESLQQFSAAGEKVRAFANIFKFIIAILLLQDTPLCIRIANKSGVNRATSKDALYITNKNLHSISRTATGLRDVEIKRKHSNFQIAFYEQSNIAYIDRTSRSMPVIILPWNILYTRNTRV